MARNRFAGPLAALLIGGLVVFIFFHNFEIVREEKRYPPSRHAAMNEYLALDRWLTEEGYEIRVARSGTARTLRGKDDGLVFLQADLFEWTEEGVQALEEWCAGGGRLVVSLRDYWYGEEDDEEARLLIDFLAGYGIFLAEEQSGGHEPYDPDAPDLGWNIAFEKPEGCLSSVEDGLGNTRVVKVAAGKGSLAAMGITPFLWSDELKKEANAFLAWDLLSSPDGINKSLLFIRGREERRGLFGLLSQRGNFALIVIPCFILLITGLWAALPVFGVVKGDTESRGGTIRGRFRAEGNFYRKYGALGVYRDKYRDDIMMKHGSAELYAEDPEAAGEALGGGKITAKNFRETIVILKTIRERIGHGNDRSG
jgi:hypothetical protein